MMNESIVHAIQSVNKVFLQGPFGTGKTTLGVDRLKWLLKQERIHGSDIQVMTPQRTLGRAYYAALRQPDIPSGPSVQLTTVASLARRSAELYWPLIAADAGFEQPAREPVFLNLETSQYHMAPLVDEALAKDAFAGIRVERSRIISQVLDNLNKAALNGYSINDVYVKLESAVLPGQHRTATLNALRSAREVSLRFRQLCYENNLVDYSLQIELLNRYILEKDWSRTHLLRSARHLIFDNVEEDTYTAHRLLRTWLPSLESALLVSDEDGGLRAFLGASPQGAENLKALCDQVVVLRDSHTMSAPMQNLERTACSLLRTSAGSKSMMEETPVKPSIDGVPTLPTLCMPQISFRFYPQMLVWVADQVRNLIEVQGVAASEIVILAPYMSDALKFSLQSELDERAVPSTTHRPSRPLRSEPAAKAMLTLAALAHPHWNLILSSGDVAKMLISSITSADPVRANLLARLIYRQGRQEGDLAPFEQLQQTVRERVTYRLGEEWDRLRAWLLAYRAQPEMEALDQFWARLFGELLSQPGFAFHRDADAARVAHQLVTASRNFRWALEPSMDDDMPESATGREFFQLVESGAIGALYTSAWDEREESVLIAPAYTFMMRNRAVDVQFWLDVGSTGWWERLYQPLTHPYVLSRQWKSGQPWTDLDEFQARQRSMRRLVLGLMRRTRRSVYLGLTQYNESGFEQHGALLTVINRLIAAEGVRTHTV